MIKGNAAEIGALSGTLEVSQVIPSNTPIHLFIIPLIIYKVQSKGVDSSGPGFADPASVVRTLALRERECAVYFDLLDLLTRPEVCRLRRRHDRGSGLGF